MASPLVNFRADPKLLAAITEEARRSQSTVSEYLRSIVREKVGLQ